MSSVPETAVCEKCGEAKPLTTEHWKPTGTAGAWRAKCRTCIQAEDRERWHARQRPQQYTVETPRDQALALAPENVHLLIDVESQRVNLTSMWRAAGAPESKRPANWKQTEQAREFLAELAESGIANDYIAPSAQRGGADGGSTWDHWQAGVEYARYLSAAFAIRWNNYARAYLEGQRIAPPDVAPAVVPPADDDAVVDFAAELYRLTGRFLEANKQREAAKVAMLGRVATAPITPDGMQIADPRRAGYVYLLEKIGARPPQYKIGFTQDDDVAKRQRAVEGQSGIETRRLHTIHSDEAERLEKHLHRHYGRKRIKGTEWFLLTAHDVSALCHLPQFIRYSDFTADVLAEVVVIQGELL